MKIKGWCIWITGLPGSGKSTISRLLKKKLEEMGIRAYIVSSDALRRIVTPKPKYSEEERDIVYGALVYTAKTLTENGINVIIDATGNKRRYRELARRNVEKFMEVYLKCSLEICMKREMERKETYSAPTNIYLKALTGKSKTVPGIGSPYEEPENPELTLDTERLKPIQCVNKIIDMLIKTR